MTEEKRPHPDVYWAIWNDANPDDPIREHDGCVIHHKDEDPWNNAISNLQKMTKGEHNRHHLSGRKRSDETRAKISAGRTGKKHSTETRAKMSAAHKGRKFSDDHKRKLSEATKAHHRRLQTTIHTKDNNEWR